MKILFDHQIFYQQPYGGISKYFVALASHLHQSGEDVTISAGLHCNQYLKDMANSRKIVHGQFFNKFPPRVLRFIRKLNEMKTNRFVSKSQPDIIHETYYSQGVLKSRCPKVVTVYDMIHEIYPDSFPKNDPVRKLKESALKRADHIISISHNTKSDLMRIHGIAESKISVTHLAAEMQNETKAADGDPSKSGIRNKPFLVYVGSRGGYKNFLGLLKVYARSDKLKNNFDLVAFGSGAFNKQEEDAIREFNLDTNCVVQVSGDDGLLSQYYRNAVAFIYPSIYEGFGLPPLEAMIAGCPVICSHSSSMPEVCSDAAAYFDPNNLDSMQNRIEEVVFSETTLADLIVKGMSRAAGFSWAKCASETKAIYKKVIG